MSDSELQGGSPRLCRLRTASIESRWASIYYVLTHTRHVESRKLSSFDGRWVGRSFTSLVVIYTGIVYGPPTDSLACGITWKTYTRERCDPARLFDYCHELWPLVLPSLLTRVVLSGYFPCKVYTDSNLYDTLGYEWWLTATPKHSNWTSFMSHMYIEMDDDHDNYLYHKMIDITCMLSIGCKPMMTSTLIWLKLA
jgi:hypothetical protein